MGGVEERLILQEANRISFRYVNIGWLNPEIDISTFNGLEYLMGIHQAII